MTETVSIIGHLPQPAAGVGVVWTPSTVQDCRIVALTATYQAANAGVTRNILVTVQSDVGDIGWQSGDNGAQLIATTMDYTISPQFTANTATQGPVNRGVGIPFTDAWIPAGYVVTPTATNINPADQWSSISYWAQFRDPLDADEIVPILTIAARE